MKIFETHAHYNDEAYDNDLDEVLKRAKSAGVEKIINASYSIEASKRSLELASKYDNIYATIGLHPNECNEDRQEMIVDLEKLYESSKKIVAIGEIGLDYHYEGYNKQNQIAMFVSQIELANRLKLPVVIHARDAINDIYEVLTNIAVPKYGLVFHCFSPSKLLVELGLKNNWYFSFTGNITYQRSKKSLEIIKSIPVKNIMVETDCPYLAPDEYKGTRNSSEYLYIIIERLADILDMDKEELAQITYDNATKFFNIK